MTGPQFSRQLGYLVVMAMACSTVGCGGLGYGRKTAPPGFAPIGNTDGHPFSQPFPNLQSGREPISLPRASQPAPIALTDFRQEGEIIELPIPGEGPVPTDAASLIEQPMPGAMANAMTNSVGESCGPGGCPAPSCGPGGCSPDGLDLQAGNSVAPMPPVYSGHNKHHAYKQESQQFRAATGQRKHHRWLASWKKDPNPDIAYNNPRFPRELRMESHPQYIVEPPDVLYIEALSILPNRPLLGERLVRQDGTISLGYYGQVHVAGLTLLEIENKIRQHMKRYVENPQIYVDVASFNSKVYYVLGQVQQQGRLPVTGKETVLDAITLAGGLTNFAAIDKMHIARPNPGGGCDQILWVDWKSLAFCGDTRTNYQVLPGDRIVIPGTGGFQTNVALDNYLSPFERFASLFGLIRFALIR
ncbi:polysaccharide biosynthesis/export family protein [bacterium]|nr:polysaccharide biosynthesis/export family protein [bacterium]